MKKTTYIFIFIILFNFAVKANVISYDQETGIYVVDQFGSCKQNIFMKGEKKDRILTKSKQVHQKNVECNQSVKKHSSSSFVPSYKQKEPLWLE